MEALYNSTDRKEHSYREHYSLLVHAMPTFKDMHSVC